MVLLALFSFYAISGQVDEKDDYDEIISPKRDSVLIENVNDVDKKNDPRVGFLEARAQNDHDGGYGGGEDDGGYGGGYGNEDENGYEMEPSYGGRDNYRGNPSPISYGGYQRSPEVYGGYTSGGYGGESYRRGNYRRGTSYRSRPRPRMMTPPSVPIHWNTNWDKVSEGSWKPTEPMSFKRKPKKVSPWTHVNTRRSAGPITHVDTQHKLSPIKWFKPQITRSVRHFKPIVQHSKSKPVYTTYHSTKKYEPVYNTHHGDWSKWAGYQNRGMRSRGSSSMSKHGGYGGSSGHGSMIHRGGYGGYGGYGSNGNSRRRYGGRGRRNHPYGGRGSDMSYDNYGRRSNYEEEEPHPEPYPDYSESYQRVSNYSEEQPREEPTTRRSNYSESYQEPYEEESNVGAESYEEESPVVDGY